MNIKKIIPLIGFIILVYILLNINLEKILIDFLKINPIYLFLSMFSIAPIILISNYQWQILLKKQKINVTYLYSLKNIFIGYFYGFISPGGYGAYIRILYLKNESKTSLQKCFSNVILFNTIDYISLLILGIFGSIILLNRSSDLLNFLITMIIILIIIIIILLIFMKKELSKKILTKILTLKPIKLFLDYNKINNSIELFYEDLPNLSHLRILFILSIGGWLLQFFELFLISKLFSININFMYFIAIISIANIIASIPITLYGLGTREIALISLFSIFNIFPEKIVSLSLFWFLIIWLIPSIFGGI
ncbi:MAG: flippase-like domain-containing protein, partial [Thermoplasmatales archaeon]|nr:flippase-like domain-containing protein [Thermoplasmatales archaeon]